jgi:hypothetical protein
MILAQRLTISQLGVCTVVIAIVKAGDFISSLYVISLAVIYVVVMILS